jgi:hypothetical protein
MPVRPFYRYLLDTTLVIWARHSFPYVADSLQLPRALALQKTLSVDRDRPGLTPSADSGPPRHS